MLLGGVSVLSLHRFGYLNNFYFVSLVLLCLVASESTAAYLEKCIPKERLHLRVMDGLGHLDFGWGKERAIDLYPQLIAHAAKCNAPFACTCELEPDAQPVAAEQPPDPGASLDNINI